MESAPSERSLGLYFHMPFCRARCRYCDFNTYAGIEHLIPDYISALNSEVSRWAKYIRGHDVDTAFFGGGTPSLIPTQLLRQVLDGAREGFLFSIDAEITVEANPGTVDRGYLSELRKAGINRLSLGVQSFLDDELRLLGRIHLAEDARQAVRKARRAGFQNINLDLIFGLPGQVMDAWTRSLNEALDLEPEHISLYGLTIEKETPLGEEVRRGLMPDSDPDIAAEMYLKAEETLAASGYYHYEISNWARPGLECRHNMRYWRCLPYLGFGTGAHSCFRGLRFENVKTPLHYITLLSGNNSPRDVKNDRGEGIPLTLSELLETGLPVEQAIPVSRRNMISDRIILGLRLNEGIAPVLLKDSTGYDLEAAFKIEIGELEDAGLLERADGRIRLSRRGRLLGNEVFQRFLDPPEG